MPTPHHTTRTRPTVSGPFRWRAAAGEAAGFTDVVYEKGEAGTDTDGIARITINRPEVRNAFRPLTVAEMIRALGDARDDPAIGVIVLTGAGDQAFCSGGDQRIRGEHGYKEEGTGMQRLNVLDFQTQIRKTPKPVIAAVNGWAVGGGHVLHVVCDLTIASDNARFMQTGPKVGSFDAGYGTSHLARLVGQKKAREIWFLCRPYSAEEALAMGLVNTVVPLAELEHEYVQWSREILANSNLAIRMIKAAANADEDGGGRAARARRPRDDAVLHDRGGAGGPQRLPRPPRTEFDADGYRPYADCPVPECRPFLTRPRPWTSVPFMTNEAHGGLSVVRGTLGVDAEDVVVEVQTSLLGLFKQTPRTFRFDLTDLEEVSPPPRPVPRHGLHPNAAHRPGHPDSRLQRRGPHAPRQASAPRRSRPGPPTPSAMAYVSETAPSGPALWLLAARPKTLPAAAAPVAVGTALALEAGAFHALAAACALLGAVFIQVGTNYANDYYDFAKGADTADRKGPTRVTQAGLVAPEATRRAAFVAFGLAVAAGVYLMLRGGWPVVAIGVLSICAGVLYTAGRWALAYLGLADLFVLVFFGPVAVAGTYYVQAVGDAAALAALPVVIAAGLGAGAAGDGDPARQQRPRCGGGSGSRQADPRRPVRARIRDSAVGRMRRECRARTDRPYGCGREHTLCRCLPPSCSPSRCPLLRTLQAERDATRPQPPPRRDGAAAARLQRALLGRLADLMRLSLHAYRLPLTASARAQGRRAHRARGRARPARRCHPACCLGPMLRRCRGLAARRLPRRRHSSNRSPDGLPTASRRGAGPTQTPHSTARSTASASPRRRGSGWTSRSSTSPRRQGTGLLPRRCTPTPR